LVSNKPTTAMAMVGGNQVHNVFVYGSLLADDVVRALLSRIPQSSPAILNGQSVFFLSLFFVELKVACDFISILTLPPIVSISSFFQFF
jgi:hypothetical protein